MAVNLEDLKGEGALRIYDEPYSSNGAVPRDQVFIEIDRRSESDDPEIEEWKKLTRKKVYLLGEDQIKAVTERFITRYGKQFTFGQVLINPSQTRTRSTYLLLNPEQEELFRNAGLERLCLVLRDDIDRIFNIPPE